jgi:transposase
MEMDGLISMSGEEIDRLSVMIRLCEGGLRQAQAADQLQISVRQLRRLLRKYRREGAAGLVSKRRGQPSNNRLDPRLVSEVLTLLYDRYTGFGPTLAQEKLSEHDGLTISVESVRQIMIAEQLWKPKRAKKAMVHPMRERRACRGELVQVDGCWYTWFEDRAPACTLLALIDDATGCLMQLLFAPRETTFAYARAMRAYLLRSGRPQTLYTDKHGIFHVNAKNVTSTPAITQFGRAMQDLDIQILCANTPQAKGRVERLHQTLQDRLVKEMRLRGINDMESANVYLGEFCADYNRRFGVQPRSDFDAHRALREQDDLARILCIQETRVLSKNLTLQYDHVIFQIESKRPAYALRGAQVTVCQSEDGGVIAILYRGIPLDYSMFRPQPRQSEVASSKDLVQKADHPPRPQQSPSPLHPWRRIGDSTSLPGRGHRTSVFWTDEDISTLG